MKKAELLAPAGSFEALEAAINAGADAIYLGGRNFGARYYANNFDNEELIKAVDLAHMYRVKIYVTVNILVDDTEFDDLVEYLKFLELIGVDAIIVQDTGVVEVARMVAPNLDIHASTQMSIMNSEAIKAVEKQGVNRVVLARECSIEEITEMRAKTNAELEVFVHGAICVAYSGQCLMSSMIGGRSGNRGRCAQPCRLPYSLVDEDGIEVLDSNIGHYLLSPKDFNTLELIPNLIEAGVSSFKIEGRMKKPEYVAIVVEAYRKAIDAYYEKRSGISTDDRRNISQVFNRDFTTAYLTERPGKNFINDKRPNNRGVLIGRVSSYDHSSRMVGIKLDEDLSVGDGIEFWVTVGGRVAQIVTELEVDSTDVQTAPKGSEVFISIASPVRVSDRVFRTFDKKLNDYAGTFFGNKMKKIPVDAYVTSKVSMPMEIKFEDNEGNFGQALTMVNGQNAIKRPLTLELLEKQIERLGNTYFTLQKIYWESEPNVMFPVSEINEARRQAIDNLYVSRINSYNNTLKKEAQEYIFPSKIVRDSRRLFLNVMVDTLEQAEVALDNGAELVTVSGETFSNKELSIIECSKIIEIAHCKGKKAIIGFPRIIKECNLSYLLTRLNEIAKLQPDAIMIGNLGLLEAAKRTQLPIWLDFGLNVFNSLAVQYWKELNISTITISPELTFAQIKKIADYTDIKLECLAQGRVEMMVSEYCVAGSFVGNIHANKCSGVCSQKLYLKDRRDEKFPIVTDQFCRMHVLNAKELSMMNYTNNFYNSGVDYLRIDARYMSRSEVKNSVVGFINSLSGKSTLLQDSDSGYTKGHYFRGVIE